MEALLDLYCLPYDPRQPTVCMDEQPRQLLNEVQKSIPAEPGQPARLDYEYERNGTANLFLFTEPLAGWRHVEVTERRTSVDWAPQIRELVEGYYPEAERWDWDGRRWYRPGVSFRRLLGLVGTDDQGIVLVVDLAHIRGGTEH